MLLQRLLRGRFTVARWGKHSIKNLSKNALNEEEFDLLNAYLDELEDANISNMEALDGFFAALACCPDFVQPSEFLEVIGQDIEEKNERIFEDIDDAMAFNTLVMRHYNYVVESLSKELSEENLHDFYVPLHFFDEATGECGGNDWALGFLLGVDLRHSMWRGLVTSEKEGGLMYPIFTLAYEHHDDPKMRPYKEAMSDEKRQEIVVMVAACVNHIYEYFKDQREAYGFSKAGSGSGPAVSMKVGRNVPCPCGSGLKYKRCCGEQARSVH